MKCPPTTDHFFSVAHSPFSPPPFISTFPRFLWLRPHKIFQLTKFKLRMQKKKHTLLLTTEKSKASIKKLMEDLWGGRWVAEGRGWRRGWRLTATMLPHHNCLVLNALVCSITALPCRSPAPFPFLLWPLFFHSSLLWPLGSENIAPPVQNEEKIWIVLYFFATWEGISSRVLWACERAVCV